MFNQWLESHSISQEIKKFLLENIKSKSYQLGSIKFESQDSFIAWNEYEDWPSLIDNKMIAIGSALNGDIWAIHFKESHPSVIVITHEEIPLREATNTIPDNVFIKVADSLEEFLILATENKLPIDFYEAKDVSKQN